MTVAPRHATIKAPGARSSRHHGRRLALAARCRLAFPATAACRIPHMPSSRKAKRERRRRRAAATHRASPSVNAPRSDEAQPAASPWAFLALWDRQTVLWGAALCAMVAVSFYPALSAGFVLDDNIFTDAPAVRAWSGLWNIWFSPSDIEREGHYWPITYTTFWLEHKLWGLTAFGTHLVNLLLYMVNVLLLWSLLRCLAVPGAWVVAAVFAVHPMHVDSVAWAIGRKDLLSGLFYMAAALCWIRSLDGVGDSQPDSRDALSRSLWRRWLDSVRVPRPGFYLAALELFAAAMLSKSVAVTLPVAFAILALVEERASDVGRMHGESSLFSWSPWVSPSPTCPTTRPGGNSTLTTGLPSER